MLKSFPYKRPSCGMRPLINANLSVEAYEFSNSKKKEN
jgi:hypothetical protein